MLGSGTLQRQQFLPLCPDFIVELRSRSDRLDTIREKMQEYLDNGMRLGWLIDPISQTVDIYRSHAEVERLQHPKTLSGEDVLPGFILQCDRLL